MLAISLWVSIAACSRSIIILIPLTFQDYEWAHVSAIAGIVSYYVFPLCLLEFLELYLDEMDYHYLLFK
jgi:hypothetical protein